jgi:hypothetical protein
VRLIKIIYLPVFTNQVPQQKIISRWTKEEELLAVQALRKHGKNFQAVAEIIGNKTEAHVKSFYGNNEKRYRLDSIIADYTADNRNGGEENCEPHSSAKKSKG